MKSAGLVTMLVLLALSLSFGQTAPRIARAKYNFNSDWKLFVGDAKGAETADFDDGNWKQVTLPRTWNEDDAFRKDIKDLSTGIAWYRKHFRLPAGTADKKIFLEFEGIRHAGEFYINGKFIGRSENGVMAFGFDISDTVTSGENVIAARIDNSWDYREKATGEKFQWNDRNFYANYGGINKNVYLHICDKLYQTLPLYSNLKTAGVYVYAKDFDIRNKTATIAAESEIRNEFKTSKTFGYEVFVKDLSGRIVKTINGGKYTLAAGEMRNVLASARIKNLNFWSWGYGYLYDVYTILRVDGKDVDTVRTRTGFRKTEFANGAFNLNDRTLQVKGYAQRTTNEWVALGSAVPAWMSDFSNRLMVEGNANLVRWMHVTPWKQDVESCDRVGLIESMPAGDSEADVTGRRWAQRVEVMRDAIVYNRNNPSIIFYESGNRGISETHMQDMKAVRDKYDPHGGRAIGSREMLDSKIAEYGGEMLYINKSSTKPLWQMEYSRDEGLRKYWDEFSPPFHKDGDGPLYNNQDANVYNRNQDSHAIEDVVRWFDYWEARPGTGTRINAGGVNIIFSDSNTHHRGAENYRRSGEVDALRIPKDGYFADQVMWDGWVDPERPRTHIIGHWNYEKGTTKNVYIVSSAEKVELFVNGLSKGFGEQSSRFLFTFKNVEWRPGEIKAVGYNSANKKVTEDIKKTAGEPAAVRLTVHMGPNGFVADGADIAIVDVEVIDKNGNRCPTALNQVNFALSGEAEWRGGIAQGPDNYVLSKILPVEGGINRVLIRSTTKSGSAILEAHSEGLKSATIQLNSRSFVSTNGLSPQFPSDGLPINLTRGPTPVAESFTMVRRPIAVTNISAGSNIQDAQKSVDDNETTNWTSDGKPDTAWIKFDFDKASQINQVVLKVVGWRTQSYPIRILVDEKAVFSGLTPRSLGYITLNIPPTLGKSVRIELTGNATNRDAFGNIVEIPGTPDTQSAAGKGGGKSTLGIVEAEFYTSSVK
jgi:beta-galactosidase